jgi:AcrR family transcriptional regulator
MTSRHSSTRVRGVTSPRRRLPPDTRRNELLDIGAELFAERPYDEVRMDEVADRAAVSRALLYRYFSSKRDLFAAIYQRAADQLLAQTEVDPAVPLAELVSAGLDAHIDYFAANRLTVLAANRTLSGDPIIQAIINDELALLRRRMLNVSGARGHQRDITSAALQAWLAFVRAICLDWLENETISRAEVRDVCLRTLWAALPTHGKP